MRPTSATASAGGCPSPPLTCTHPVVTLNGGSQATDLAQNPRGPCTGGGMQVCRGPLVRGASVGAVLQACRILPLPGEHSTSRTTPLCRKSTSLRDFALVAVTFTLCKHFLSSHHRVRRQTMKRFASMVRNYSALKFHITAS